MERIQKELKNVIAKVKQAQKQFQDLVEERDWVAEAKKYAEKRSTEVKKLIHTDVKMVRQFLEKERKELEKIQKKVPGEIKKVRAFVESQKKEFEKLLKDLAQVTAKNVSSNVERNFKKKKSTPARSKKSSDERLAESLRNTPGQEIRTDVADRDGAHGAGSDGAGPATS